MPDTDPHGTTGPFDEDWVRAAGRREESAEDRIARYGRISAEHERVQQQPWRGTGTTGSTGARDRQPGGLSVARWFFALTGIVLAILLVVWLVGIGRPLVDDGPVAYLGGDTARQGPGETTTRELGPADLPPPGADAQRERILPAVAPPADPGEYSFLAQERGNPVTYSPCRRLEVVVNTRGGPPGAYEAVQEAVAQVSAASGLSLTMAGDTDEGFSRARDPYQPQRYGQRWAPILVTWASSEDVAEFGGDAVGLGGSLSIDPGPGPASYVTGEVTLNSEYFAVPTTAGLLREVLLHEFGHVLGLGHVGDESQLMTASARGGRPLGSGDLAGLALLGQGPCTPRL